VKNVALDAARTVYPVRQSLYDKWRRLVGIFVWSCISEFVRGARYSAYVSAYSTLLCAYVVFVFPLSRGSRKRILNKITWRRRMREAHYSSIWTLNAGALIRILCFCTISIVRLIINRPVSI
jgi:hypothetical protein